MKGLLRVYDDLGDTFKCRLNWTVIQENYLNFYEDKKSRDPTSFVNLSGCLIKKIFNDSYNINMIEITTSQNHMLLLTPDNMKDYNKWNEQLYIASQKFRDSYEDQRPEAAIRASRVITDMSELQRKSQRISQSRPQNQNALHPSNNIDNNNPDNVIDRRKRNNESTPRASNGYRRESAQNSRKNSSENQWDSMPIYQNPSHERRESTNSVVKRSSRELTNQEYKRPSTHYKDRRESNISAVAGKHRSRAIETVKEDPMMSDNEVLETKPIEELRKKYPITDKTKRWSIAATDLVGKTNDELFLMLIQLNREKAHMEIWKDSLGNEINEIDEKLKERLSMQTVNELEKTRTHYEEQLQNIEYLMNLAHPLISFMDAVVQMSDAYAGNNDAFHVVYHQLSPTGNEDFSNIEFIRHNQERQVAKLINENKNTLVANSISRDNGSDKENNAEILLNLENSEEFLSRRTGLSDVIDDISAQLEELEPLKVEIERYIGDMDNEYDIVLGKNSTLPVNNSKGGSIKNVRKLKDDESKNNNSAFMPRRSTRKAPKSDMTPSLIRKDTLKRQGSVGARSKSASLRYPANSAQNINDGPTLNLSNARRSFNVNTAIERDSYVAPVMAQPVTPRSQKSKTSTMNFSDSIGKSSSSKVQNQLRDLMRTDPYEEKRSPSPIYRDRSSILSVQELQAGPLIKLNTGLFQSVHGPKRSINNNNVVERPLSRVSMSESDISVGSHRINQRLNLNQQFDDKKNWKSPSGNYQTPELSTPEKVNIGERYRSSVVNDEDINEVKSRKIRQIAANESFSRLTKDDGGQRNQRESQLLNNARLAQEASRRSRELQKA